MFIFYSFKIIKLDVKVEGKDEGKIGWIDFGICGCKGYLVDAIFYMLVNKFVEIRI